MTDSRNLSENKEQTEAPIVYMMLGFPGSGKTYFVGNLVKEINAIHLNSDAMRTSIFGSREQASVIYHSKDRAILNTYTFGAFDYAASQILKSGNSVVYDANNNSIKERESIRSLALKNNALAITIWIQTPKDIALMRLQDRRETNGQPKLTASEAIDVIDKHIKQTEVLKADEQIIKIDGTIPFQQQFEYFRMQLMNKNQKVSDDR